MLQDFIEVRGLGLINIRTIFGETACRRKMRLRLICHLDRRQPGPDDPCRLPLQQETQDILGVKVARVVLPVAAGRNLAVLLEAAVRSTILKAARHRLHPGIHRPPGARAARRRGRTAPTEPPALAARRRRLLRSIAKREDMQPVFSFKIRGAYNKMANLSPGRPEARRDLRLGRQPRPGRGAVGGQARLCAR